MQCEAKSKRTGEQCKRYTDEGKRVCSIHGGKTPSGTASPHYRTGRYSKHLPARLSGQYEASKNDPALLELREDIALIDSRLSDLIKRVDTGESGQIWKDLVETYSELDIAIRKKDSIMMGAMLTELNRLIIQGKDDYRAWSEIHEVIEQRRRLVESERKRISEAKSSLTIDQAMLMISALTDIIRTHVTDRKILSAITADVDKLIMVEG